MDNFIRRTRRALGLNQAEFGQRIGKSHQSVQLYEKTGTAPDDVMKIIRGLAAEQMLVAEVAEIDRNPNPVTTLRGQMGLNAKAFAHLVGCTVAELSAYESGTPVAPAHSLRMQSVATERGFTSLAVQLGAEQQWVVDRVLHPTGHTVLPGKRPEGVRQSTRATGLPSRYAPQNTEQHDALEEILNSGDPDAKPAVESNLVTFLKYVRLRQSSSTHKKSAG